MQKGAVRCMPGGPFAMEPGDLPLVGNLDLLSGSVMARRS